MHIGGSTFWLFDILVSQTDNGWQVWVFISDIRWNLIGLFFVCLANQSLCNIFSVLWRKHMGRDSAREFVVLEVTSYATTHKQLAKTTVVVACLALACDWTLCVPLVIQVLRVSYSYPSTFHYHYRNCLYYVKAYWGLNYSVNKKINVHLPSFIARTTVNRCQSSVADFEPDYVTRQGQGENQARNCSRKRLWVEPEHVTIDNRRRRNSLMVM